MALNVVLPSKCCCGGFSAISQKYFGFAGTDTMITFEVLFSSFLCNLVDMFNLGAEGIVQGLLATLACLQTCLLRLKVQLYGVHSALGYFSCSHS